MKLLVIDNAEITDRKFNQPLFDFIKMAADCDIISYTEVPRPKLIQANYDGVVLGGVPLHYSFASIDQRASHYKWIKRCKLPVLGICLGHQVIGELFGSRVVHLKKPEKGDVITYIKQDDSLLAGLTPEFSSYMLHRAAITVPSSFKILASTDLCENAIMRHKVKDIYGLQLHPELSSSGFTLINNFISMVKERKQFVSQSPSLISLDIQTDTLLAPPSQGL